MEKSQLERQIKTLRKHLFQPMLSFQLLAELNVWLKDQCLKLMQTTKHPDETSLTVIQALERERPASSATILTQLADWKYCEYTVSH